MNEQRLQAYANLINQLLTRPNGDEPQILNANRELLDAGLLLVTAQVAEQLEANGNQNHADFLRHLGSQLVEALGISETPTPANPSSEDHLQFLMEVLQATWDSGANSQVVYPLLAANQDKLDYNFIAVLQTWAKAKLPEVEPSQARSIAADIGNFGNLIQQFPLGNKAANMEISLACYEISLTVFTRHSHAETWAAIQNSLGTAYSNRIQGDTAENLEKAIAAYKKALEVYTKDAFRNQWAMTQNNLGNAYRNRIQGDTAENLEKAIAAYQYALDVYKKDAFPNQWAMTQNNLGTAYSNRIQGDTAENLEKAIAAYQYALDVYTKDAFPNDWAMTQNNLGNAYRDRIQGDTAENLEMAIAAYKKALEVYTKDAFPNQWATTQNNLGNAYRNRIQGDTAENLEMAIAAYQYALEVRTKDAFPNQWATTQNNLGNAYRNRIQGDTAENLELAIAAYQYALEVRTKDAFPNQWATTQNNLGAAYSDRIQGDTAENLEIAIAAYQYALEVYKKDAFPNDWAMTQNNLGSAYLNRILGDTAENLEMAIAAYQYALDVYKKDAFPNQWAMTQNNLGAAYRNRIQGDTAENLEKAIAAYQYALDVYKKDAFPNQWAMTQNNLGNAYSDRIQGDTAENLEKAIAAYQYALEVYKKEANPVKCLATSRNLGNLHFKQGNWQPAIDAYKQAITAVELSRSWSKDDDRRQEILKNAIGVYANTVQCFVNLQQYPQAFEYAERSRSRQLVDLMASKDLYHQGEIPPEVEKLLKKFDTLARQIHNLRFPNQSQGDGNDNRKRAAWEATNQEIAEKEAEKQQVYRQIRQLDRVLAEQIQVAPLDFSQLQELIEDDTTAILSFYSTNDDTHAFIVRRSGVDLHTCEGQGRRELQIWLRDNWLKPYADISYLPAFAAAAQLLGCEVQAIKSLEPGEAEITVLFQDGTSHAADKAQFEELWKLEKAQSINDWNQQMPSKLAEIAQWLELDKLADKLKGIQELILIPHLYLHQIPFAALPVADGQYLGDQFLIRTLASCQVLDFCARRPPLATQPPTYGIVEDATQDLPCASYEGRQVAQIYQVADSQYLKGSQATVRQYKQLLPQVQRLLSMHHAQSRLDDNLESALILADGKITLGQLLSPALRFPNLDEVFLSCCETNLGQTDLSDNMMTLNTGFLCAGARGAVSTLWSVDDLATSLFSIFYHHQRQAGQNRPQALQLAQRQLRQLTGKEFKKKYQKELEKVLTEKLKEAHESFREAEKQRDHYPEDSPEYKEWEKKRAQRVGLYNRIGKIKNKGLKETAKKEHPFAELQYWSGFICAGLR